MNRIADITFPECWPFDVSASNLGLFFLDDSVAAGLQLIRRLIQPRSTDVPHVTLRYSDIDIPHAFKLSFAATKVEELILEGPGTFDVQGYELGSVGTAFLSCGAPELEAISYKPDFPDSIFHISLYDGRTSTAAWEMLDALGKFDWNLRYAPGRTEIMSFEEFRSLRSDINNAPAALTRGAASAFRALSGEEPTLAGILALPWATRLQLIERLAEGIHDAPNVRSVGVTSKYRESREHLILQANHQAPLFTDLDLGLHEGFHAKTPDETATVITPPEIAAEVVEHALEQLLPDAQHISLLDPAVGGGVFFAALMARVARHDLSPALRVTSAVGVEKRVQRARLTQHSFEGAGLWVLMADFLGVSPPDLFSGPHDQASQPNLLLANPPYMRPSVESGNAYDIARVRIRDRLGIDLSKRANLYIYFVLHADAFLEPGAVASWVLPGEVLYSDSAEPLRKYLISQVDLLSVHVYSDSVRFHRRRVSTVVITYRKGAPSPSGRVHWSRGDSLLSPETRSDVERDFLRTEARWSANGFDEPNRSEYLEGVELGRLFKVSRGIATGGNSVFVVEEDTRRALRLEESQLRPLLPKPRELNGSVVAADASGSESIHVRRWLIDSKLPWEELRRQAPNIWLYLSTRLHVALNALPSRRHPFYRQEAQDVPPIVFIAMTGNTRGGDRFVLNETSGLALNNYHVLYPNQILLHWMSEAGLNMVDIHRALQDVSAQDLTTWGRTFYKGSVKLEPGDLRKVLLRNTLFLNALASATGWERMS